MFPGFSSMDLEPDNIYRGKWAAIDWSDDGEGVFDALAILTMAALNRTVNRQIKYVREAGGRDTWQAPLQTWHTQSGDCEDIAILKFAALRKHKPMMIVGRISGGEDHAFVVCGGSVLDNKFDKLISRSQYINMTPIYGFSDEATVRFVRGSFTIAEAIRGGR